MMAACAPAPEAPPLTAQQQADAYADAMDAADPCTWTETTRDGIRIMRFVPPGDCLAMEPSEVMSGIWYDGFEEREFFPNATTAPARRVFSRQSAEAMSDSDFWLSRAEANRVTDDQPRLGTRAVLITFVGRRTKPYLYPNGRRGMPVIVVDRLLTWRVLGVIQDFIDCRDFPPRNESGPPCAPGTEGPRRAAP